MTTETAAASAPATGTHQEATPAAPAQRLHPLVERCKTTFRSWNEWLEAWNSTDNAEMLDGLIHCGFNVPYDRDEFADRVCFYLEVADGYCNHDLRNRGREGDYEEKHFRSSFVRTEKDCLNNLSLVDIRKKIATRAVKILVAEIFSRCPDRMDDRSSKQRAWERIVHDQTIMKKIMWFFRIDDHLYSDRPRNIPHDGYPFYKEFKEFLIALCWYAWDSEYSLHSREKNDELALMLEIRPRCVQFLSYFKEVRMLLKPNWLVTSKEMRVLKRLALSEKTVELRQWRGTVEVQGHILVAVARGIPEAMVYHSLATRRAFLRKLDATHRIELQMEALREKQAALTGKK
jgi:hypothetical protein